jgi:hypothetical protein
MKRRDLLKSALYAAPLVTAGRLYAAPMSGPRLLVVFLRGAYDAANILVPVSSDFYYSVRPNLAVPKTVALPLDTDWGLHPALKDSLYPLWQQKQIAFIPFAGTDDTSRSHFETQDTIELGQPVGVPGRPAHPQHRAQLHRQARRQRPQRSPDPGHVSGPGPGARRGAGLPSAERGLYRHLRRDDGRQPQCRHHQGL